MRPDVYEVFIIPPEGNPFDPLHRELGIYVKQMRDGKQFALKRDGSTWEALPEGASYDPNEFGLILPAEAYPALLVAVERAQGRQHHSPTEAAVLREWLQAERDRNDKVFDMLARGPQLIDYGAGQKQGIVLPPPVR